MDYARRHPVEPPLTQYELPGVTEEMQQHVPVAVVPLWHAVITTRLAFPASDRDSLKLAQQRLNAALTETEAVDPLGPSGIFVQVDGVPGRPDQRL